MASPTLSRNTRLRPTESGGTRETTSSRPMCRPSTSGPGSSTTSITVLVWNSSRNAPPISSSNNALVSASNWNSLVVERVRMEPVPARPLYGPLSLRYSTPRLWNMTFVMPVRSISSRAQTASMIVRSMRVRPSCVISASSPVWNSGVEEQPAAIATAATADRILNFIVFPCMDIFLLFANSRPRCTVSQCEIY